MFWYWLYYIGFWCILIPALSAEFFYSLYQIHVRRKYGRRYNIAHPARIRGKIFIGIIIIFNLMILPIIWRMPWTDLVNIRVVDKKKSIIEAIYQKEMQHEWHKVFFLDTKMFGFKRLTNAQKD